MKQFRRNLAYYCPVRLRKHRFLQLIAAVIITILTCYLMRLMESWFVEAYQEENYYEQYPELVSMLTSMLIFITAYLGEILCILIASDLASIIFRLPIFCSTVTAYKNGSRPSTYMITEEYALPIVTKKAGKAYLQISFTQSELARINAKRRWHEYVVKLPAANYPIGIGSTIQICLSTRCFVEILHQLASHECVIFEVKLSNRGDLRSWPMISYYETSLLLKKMQRHEIDNVYEIPTGDIGSITLSKDELFDYERRLTGDRDYIYLNRRYFE